MHPGRRTSVNAAREQTGRAMPQSGKRESQVRRFSLRGRLSVADGSFQLRARGSLIKLPVTILRQRPEPRANDRWWEHLVGGTWANGPSYRRLFLSGWFMTIFTGGRSEGLRLTLEELWGSFGHGVLSAAKESVRPKLWPLPRTTA